MRLLSSLAVILVLLLSLGLWSNYSLQKSTDQLSSRIDQISYAVEVKHWETARIMTGKLETNWQKNAKWWPIFLDHQEMDNIDFSLAKVEKYVASQDAPLSLGQLSELKLMVKHIPEKEAVNIENIL